MVQHSGLERLGGRRSTKNKELRKKKDADTFDGMEVELRSFLATIDLQMRNLRIKEIREDEC
jgi:hypothetical protein